MKHSPNCPACQAADLLKITGEAERDLLHVLGHHMVEANNLRVNAESIGFDLSDAVIDTLAECLDTAQQDAAVLRAHMN